MNPDPCPLLTRISKKLITHEDSFYAHKLLGIMCLLHFLYRAYLLLTSGSMQFDSSSFFLPGIMVHMLLSASSLIFKLSKSDSRVKSIPVIYPEFRMHSLVFAYRSLFLMLLNWFYTKNNATSPVYLRGLIVIGTLSCADAVTRLHDGSTRNGSTMRDMPFPGNFSERFRRRLNLWYGLSQVLATSYLLFSTDGQNAFLVLFPIQLAPFLKTLCKKGFLSSTGIFYINISP